MRLAVAVILLCSCVTEADLPGGIFRDKRNGRTVLQPQSGAQNAIEVHTVDEFIAALTALPAVGTSGNCYGKAIDVVADLSFSEPIVLGRQHDGLRITSRSRSRITTTTHLARWVKFKTRDLQIDNFFFANGFDATTIFEADEDDNSANTVLRDHTISESAVVDSFTVLNEGGGQGMLIAHNRLRVGANVKLVALVGDDPYIGGPYLDRTTIMANDGFQGGIEADIAKFSTFFGNIDLGGITVTSASGTTGRNTISGNVMSGDITISDDGQNAITGNAMQGNNIDTSASGGLNTISGNTNIGGGSAFAGTDNTTGGNT